MNKVAGSARGGRVNVKNEVEKLIVHQLRVGGLQAGKTAYLKFAMDGTSISKKEVATASTITLSNERKALSIATISIVMTAESYEVVTDTMKLQKFYGNIF